MKRDAEKILVDPTTGGQKGQKLCQMSCLDPLALKEIGRVAGYGAAKHGRLNFTKGYPWSWSLDALERHLLDWKNGEELDQDPQALAHELYNMAQVAWHACALLSFSLRKVGTDDRISSVVKVKKCKR